jgi:hypothetical protein
MHTLNIKMMDPFTVDVLAFVSQFDRFLLAWPALIRCL